MVALFSFELLNRGRNRSLATPPDYAGNMTIVWQGDYCFVMREISGAVETNIGCTTYPTEPRHDVR
jgi:hypothetical protein